MWENAIETVSPSIGVILGRAKMLHPGTGRELDMWNPLGTAFMIAHKPNPTVLTNDHVVRGDWLELALMFRLGGTTGIVAGAGVRAHEPAIDIAVVEASPEAEAVPVVRFRAETPRRGSPIGALGFPMPRVKVQGKEGRIEAVERFSAGFVSADSYTRQMEGDPAPFAQLELNLLNYPGNSGAPCFDVDGRVVGVCRGTALYEQQVAAFALAVRMEEVFPVLANLGLRVHAD